MKVTTTKTLVMVLAMTLSPFTYAQGSKKFSSIDEIISSHGGHPVVQKTGKPKKFVLKKNKKGIYPVEFPLFRDYDLKKRKPGKQLSRIVNKKISILGYTIPLDVTPKRLVKRFLLVPYMPSCTHVPPPTENMIIDVTVNNKKGVKVGFMTTVTGKLKFEPGKEAPNPYFPTGVFKIKTTNIKELKY